MRLHQITVDSREQTPPPQTTVAALEALSVSAAVGTLPYGDFRWVVEPEDPSAPWWSVAVERKSTKDLVASTMDGRLARFIDETGGAEPPQNQIRALLVEGDVEAGVYGYRGRDWSAEQIEALLFDVQMLGIVVLRSPSVRATPSRLKAFWKWSGKDSHTALLKPALPGISDDYLDKDKKAAVRILMCLPGWGETRARAAIAEMNSPGAVLSYLLEEDDDKFKSVPGIGKGLVAGAQNFLWNEV